MFVETIFLAALPSFAKLSIVGTCSAMAMIQRTGRMAGL